MSGMSPDHAVTVDALLAKRIEILRGPTTLLYSAGNTAGVINVVDNKIPTAIPEKGYEGQFGVRFGSASKECRLNLCPWKSFSLAGTGNV